MTMLFRQICAFVFLIIFSGIFGVSAQSSDVEKNSSSEELASFAESSAESELIEIPDSHILLNSTTYNVKHGLSQNTVTSFAKDHDGFLWVGTINGLNRFDGTTFKSYFKNDGLPSPFIRSLHIEKDGNLYIGTNKGLAYYDKINDSLSLVNVKESNKSPIWMIKKHKDDLYFSTDKALIRIKANNQVETVYKFKDVIDIRDFDFFENSIYINTYNKELISIKNNASSIISSNVTSIEKVGNNLYFSDNSGLKYISKGVVKAESKTRYEKLTSNNKQLFGVTHKSIVNITKRQEVGKIIHDLHITSLYVNSGYYLGSFANGYLTTNKKSNLISQLDIENKSVWGMATNGKHFFYATNDSKIVLLDKNYSITNKLETNILGYKHLAFWGRDLYIGSADGLFKLEEKNQLKPILSKAISFLESKENELYIGTEEGYIYKFSHTTPSEKTLISKNQIVYDIEKHHDNFIVSTSNGVYLVSKTSNKKLYSGQVYQGCINNKNYYFGSNSSILRLDLHSQKVKNIVTSNKSIFSIHCSKNSILASSQSEILLFNINKDKFVRLERKNGSQAEYNTSPIINYNDKIIIAGTNGLSRLSPKKIDAHLRVADPIKVNLTSLSVFNEVVINENQFYSGSLNLAKEIMLKHSEYPFTLHFSSLNDDVTYKYRLKGLDDTWITAYFNSATFTNLAPNSYQFEVKAIDRLTQSESNIKSISIQILPPWWLSIIAKLFYALFGIFIVILFIISIHKKRQTQLQIAMSEERLKLSLWGSGDEMWDWDIETGKIYRSNMWESLDFPVVGQRADNENQRSNIHPMDRKRVHQHLEDHLHDKTEHFEISYRVKSKDNQWIWILDRAKVVVRDDDGTPMRMTGTIKNINDLKNTEEQLKLFGKAIENISEGMFILDHSFTFIEVNQACLDITQTTKEDYLGKILKFDQYPDSYSHQIQHMLRNHGRWTNEVDAKRGDGTSFTMDLTIDAIYDDNGNVNHYVAVFSDVSLRKQHEVELQKMSTSDVLTGLPNRSYLQVTLSNLVKRQVSHVLMILDIDNFKKINDSLGHNVGDELLQMVTQRIIAAVKGEANIYRLGGDEFAILVESHPDTSSSAAMANRVIDTFKSPIEIESTKLVVGASIGIVFYPDDEENEQALLRKAEVAMYSAKSAGGNRYHFYSESQNSNAIRQLEVENLIREGLANDYFEVYYQPKVNVKSNKLAGMEALVRLIHPEHGMISPAEFIPLAEETGLIVELGDIVLQKACRATQKWRIENNFDGRVAVNLSSRQFALSNLQERIQHILDETGLPAENLEIEITESTVIKHPERAIKVMEKLTQMGIHLALDDFGTGYSSLTYLKRFPIHCLKIDKAFIDDIDKSDRDLKMVDSIITIAHNMGLSVVAEGVEEQSQLGILRALKCEEIQGYLFSKPLPTSEFQNQLK